MKIVQVAFGKTFNLGNYESLRMDVQVEVSEGDDTAVAMQEARSFVEAQYAAYQGEQEAKRERERREHEERMEARRKEREAAQRQKDEDIPF